MFELVFTTIILGFVSTVQCGPMPQYLINGGQNQRQDEQNHAIDRFTTRLVGNSKIRENYLNCFLDDGPCSPEANNIKRMVPDAIQNECAHCTELQKRVIEKMMCYLNNHQPDILREVAAKFDPNGEYMKQFINNLERNGNGQFLNPNLLQNQPQQNPNLHQYQPQQNPNQPQLNPNQPQPNPNQPHLHQNQPQFNPNQPQLNPNQPQQHQHQSQSNSNQQHLHQNQPQSNLNQPHLHQHQTQQNPNQPQEHQHQHQQQQPKQNQYQPQQYQNQPQQHQHEQQLKATVVTTAPISYTATQKP